MGTIWSNSDGLEVHFGTRRSSERGNFGVHRKNGGDVEYVVVVSGADFAANVYGGTTISVPAGFTIREVLGEIITPFVMTGTSAVINVGVSGSESTNRMAQVTEAQAESAAGTVVNLTSTAAGTLASGTPLASASTVTVALGGTTPTVTTAGRLKIVVRGQDTRAV